MTEDSTPRRRRNDDLENTPRKRKGEFYAKVPLGVPLLGGMEMAASGTTVILTLIAIAAVGLGVLHDLRSEDHMRRLEEAQYKGVKAQLVNACITTLTAEQKEEYRRYGSYCWDNESPLPFFVGRTK